MTVVPKTFWSVLSTFYSIDFFLSWVLSQNCRMLFLTPFTCQFLFNHIWIGKTYGEAYELDYTDPKTKIH